jgi:hypothetical protein
VSLSSEDPSPRRALTYDRSIMSRQPSATIALRSSGLGKVAVVWRGDRTTRREATPQNNRFRRIFEELGNVGIEAEPAVYDEEFADEVRAQLQRVDGVLVWVNPLQNGKTRQSLDGLLREVARKGPWVSAHPDAILALGTKEVLVRTRHLTCGSDTHLYNSTAQFRREFPARLAEGRTRVLKQNRGNDGQGVWKVELVGSGGAAKVRVLEAADEKDPQDMSLEEFMDRCQPYFSGGGPMVDQPFQERLTEGMIRCYMAADRVAGFAHQYPKGLLPPGHVRPHGNKLMYPPDADAFRTLREKMEGEWVHQLLGAVRLDAATLPVIWDADFLYGPKTATGDDTYVLCEINVSSVFAIPDEAARAIALVVARRLKTTDGEAV